MAFFKCPLTQKLICEPVALQDGQVCERAAIEEWFRRGHCTSPLTGLSLSSFELVHMPEVTRMVAQYIDKHNDEDLPQLDSHFIDKVVSSFQTQYTAEVVPEGHGDYGLDVQVVPAQTQGARGALSAEMQVSRVADFVPLLAAGSMAEIDYAVQALENLVVYDPGDNIKNHSVALAIRNVGGIRSLALLAHNGTRSQRESAGFILWKVCVPENENSFAQNGVPFALYTLLQTGTPTAKTYAQRALSEMEAVAQKRRLSIQLSDDHAAPIITEMLAKLSDEPSEAVHTLMRLADLAATDPDNPVAIKNCSGVPLITELLQHGSMAVREAAAIAISSICVPENELDIRQAGVVAALRALDFEGAPSAQYVASHALEALTRLEADRRVIEAQKRALLPGG